MKRKVTSVEELCTIFDRSRKSLFQWSKEGCPCSKEHKVDGHYDVAAVRRWLKKHGHLDGPKRGRGAVVTGSAYRDAQAEEKKIKVQLAQLALEEKRGALVSWEEVKRREIEQHDYMISVLESWTRSLGPALTGKSALEINRAMKAKVAELMREFAGKGKT